MNHDCLFCRIVAGEIPSQRVYEDQRCIAFRDIAPQAPTHVLIVPREHMPNIVACAARDDDLVGHLMRVATQLANELGLTNGFRVIVNCGPDGAQTVEHMHVHLLGGHPLSAQMA